MKSPKIGDVSLGDISIGEINLQSKEDAVREFLEKPDLTEAAQEEIGDQLKQIRSFEAKFKERWKFEGDAGHFFSICFESKQARDDFLKERGIRLVHDDHVMYEDIRHIFTEV